MGSQSPSRSAAFVELLTCHKSQLFGYIFALVQNQADAEDLFQQTSLVLWQKFATYQPGSDFMRWSVTTARFEVLNFLKRKRRSRVCFSEEFLLELAEEQQDQADEVDARQTALSGCLEKLSAADQQLLRNCYSGLMSVKQTAAQLGRSASSVSDSLTRIRRKLHACVQRAMSREQLP